MSRDRFALECGLRLIDITIALENPSIQEALRNQDDELVLKLLDSEF